MANKFLIQLMAANNYDVDFVSDSTGLKCEDVSLTRQSEAEEADINTIVKRFGVTGVLPNVERPPRYGDFVGLVNDFQTAQNLVVAATRSFEKLPGHVREMFNNDPALWVDYAETASDEALKAAARGKLQEGNTAESGAAPSSPTGGEGDPPK
jgi:hypothetical protein